MTEHLPPTPSQTIGPFFRIGTEWLAKADVPEEPKDAVAVHGLIIDGNGEPVPDALVELWRAETRTFYRCLVNDDGIYQCSVQKKGGAFDVTIFARGLQNRLVTRMRLSDDPEITSDPIFALVPTNRRNTLVAQRLDDGSYEWNVHLQGEGETVFLAS